MGLRLLIGWGSIYLGWFVSYKCFPEHHSPISWVVAAAIYAAMLLVCTIRRI